MGVTAVEFQEDVEIFVLKYTSAMRAKEINS